MKILIVMALSLSCSISEAKSVNHPPWEFNICYQNKQEMNEKNGHDLSNEHIFADEYVSAYDKMMKEEDPNYVIPVRFSQIEENGYVFVWKKNKDEAKEVVLKTNKQGITYAKTHSFNCRKMHLSIGQGSGPKSIGFTIDYKFRDRDVASNK